MNLSSNYILPFSDIYTFSDNDEDPSTVELSMKWQRPIVYKEEEESPDHNKAESIDSIQWSTDQYDKYISITEDDPADSVGANLIVPNGIGVCRNVNVQYTNEMSVTDILSIFESKFPLKVNRVYNNPLQKFLACYEIHIGNENDISLSPEDRLHARMLMGRILYDTLLYTVEQDIESLPLLAEKVIDIYKYKEDGNLTLDIMEQVPRVMDLCETYPDSLGVYIRPVILPSVIYHLFNSTFMSRNMTQAALLVLLEQNQVDDDILYTDLIPAIMHYADDYQVDGGQMRVEAATVLTKMCPLLGSEFTRNYLLEKFILLCVDSNQNVRRVCVSNFIEVCSVLDEEEMNRDMMPAFVRLSNDRNWSVRRRCMEVFVPLSKIASAFVRREVLAPNFLRLLSDKSSWVSVAAFNCLGPFISTFADAAQCSANTDDESALQQSSEISSIYKEIDSMGFAHILKTPNHFIKEEDPIFNETNFWKIPLPDIDISALVWEVTERSVSVEDRDFDCGQCSDFCPENLYATVESLKEQIAAKPKYKMSSRAYPQNLPASFRINETPTNSPETDSTSSDHEELGNIFINKEGIGVRNILNRSNNTISYESNSDNKYPVILPDINIKIITSDENLDNNSENTGRNIFTQFDGSPLNIENIQGAISTQLYGSGVLDKIYSPVTMPCFNNDILIENSNSFDTGKGDIGKDDFNVHIVNNDFTVHAEDSPFDHCYVNCPYSETPVHEESRGLHDDETNESTIDFEHHSIEDNNEIISHNSVTTETNENVTGEQSYSKPDAHQLAQRFVRHHNRNRNYDNLNQSSSIGSNRDEKDAIFKLLTEVIHSTPRSTCLAPSWTESIESTDVNEHQAKESDIGLNSTQDIEQNGPAKRQESFWPADQTFMDEQFAYEKERKAYETVISGVNMQNVVPEELLKSYLMMVYPPYLDEKAQSKFDCAFSLPGVALAVGKQQRHIIMHTYQKLAFDDNWKIRRTLAASIHEMASILGEETADNILLKIYINYIHDMDAVRHCALRSLSSFMKTLSTKKSKELLPKLSSFLIDDSMVAWRIKLTLVEQIGQIADIISESECFEFLCPIVLKLMETNTVIVRRNCYSVISKLVKILYADNDKYFVKHFTLPLIASSWAQIWWQRQDFVFLANKMLLDECIPLTFWCSQFFPELMKLVNDKVPNVRMAVAKTLSTGLKPMAYFKECLNEYGVQVQEALDRLENDVDRDVRQSCQD